MKNLIIAGCCSGLLLLGCKPKDAEPEQIDKAQLQAEIQSLENNYASAANVGDAKKVTEDYYAEDAVSYEQEAAPLVGRAAIKTSMSKQLGEMPKGTTIGFVVKEVLPSSDGNQVVEIGSYRVKDSTGTAFSTGHYFAVFEKRDGKYVCVRDISTPDTKKE